MPFADPFLLLAGTFLLTLVPHVVQFPLWMSIGVVVAMILRSIIEVCLIMMWVLTALLLRVHAWDEVWIDAKYQPATGEKAGHWMWHTHVTARLPMIPPRPTS